MHPLKVKGLLLPGTPYSACPQLITTFTKGLEHFSLRYHVTKLPWCPVKAIMRPGATVLWAVSQETRSERETERERGTRKVSWMLQHLFMPAWQDADLDDNGD